MEGRAGGHGMEEKKKILIADDNEEIREVVRVLLESEGYEVMEAENGEEAAAKTDPDVDLIILDVMMPVKSGLTACREIREKSKAPILFLTAKTQDADKAMGFSLGGDDYLAKPFSYTDLMVRVKALLRRYTVYQGKKEPEKEERVRIGDLLLDKEKNQVFIGARELSLTEIEYRLLRLMAENRGKIFSTQNLYESVWQEEYFYTSNNTVMAHIKNLRKKVEQDPQNPKWIKTVWGRGYRIE